MEVLKFPTFFTPILKLELDVELAQLNLEEKRAVLESLT